MIRTACLAAVCALLLAAPSNAEAYWGCYGWGYGAPWGYGYNNINTYGYSYIPPPPYYAVHPPVYYSPHITARHYGASPYAWYPGMSPITYAPAPAAMMAASGPAIIENPHKPGARPAGTPRAEAPPAKSPLQPVKIENPYVASARR